MQQAVRTSTGDIYTDRHTAVLASQTNRYACAEKMLSHFRRQATERQSPQDRTSSTVNTHTTQTHPSLVLVWSSRTWRRLPTRIYSKQHIGVQQARGFYARGGRFENFDQSETNLDFVLFFQILIIGSSVTLLGPGQFCAFLHEQPGFQVRTSQYSPENRKHVQM